MSDFQSLRYILPKMKKSDYIAYMKLYNNSFSFDLSDAAKYGAGLGGAYAGMSYVGEGESRLLNAATGVTAGGVLGLGDRSS